MLQHAELTSLFEDERSLPDGVVEGTTVDDWRRLLQALLESGCPLDVEGRAQGQIAADVLPSESDDDLHTVKVWPGEGVQINVFPLAAGSIDFDFDTSELRDQRAVDALSAFIELVGTTVEADVVVCCEGGGSPLFVFDHEASRFRFSGE